MADPSLDARLTLALRRLGARLRLLRAGRGAILGAWIGLAVAAVSIAGGKLGLLPVAASLWAPAVIVGVGVLAGAAASGLRPLPGLEELALLLDRILRTDEAAVTAVGLSDADREARAPLVAALAQRLEGDLDPADPRLRTELPFRPPRRSALLPLAAAAVAALLFAPALPGPSRAPSDDPVEEAERLAERKEALERELGTELPDDVDQAFDDLIAALRKGEAGRTEAERKAEALDRALEAMKDRGDGVAGAFEQARDAVADADPEAGQDLEDAAQEGDLEAAAQAVERMRERMEKQEPRARDKAAEALEQASRAAAEAGREELSEALAEEAKRARGEGDPGETGESGGSGESGAGDESSGDASGSGESGAGDESSGDASGSGESGAGDGDADGDQPGGLAEYLRELDRQGVGGDLADAARQDAMAQRLQGALDGAGANPYEAGANRQGGQGGSGRGEGGWGAGKSHTDEDQGGGPEGSSHQTMNRQVDGVHRDWVTEFGQDHAERRLEGIQAVTSTVDVALGEGPVDVETMRRTGSDERSGRALVQAPAGYREAAEEAIDGEGVPRIYREQVKTYFDAIE